MTWMLLDNGGNAVGAYDDAVMARAAMRAIVQDEPESAQSLLLVEYDESGNAVGEAMTYDDLPASSVSVRVATFDGISVFLTRPTVGFAGDRQFVDVPAARVAGATTLGGTPVVPV